MEAYVHMTGYVGGDVEFRNVSSTPMASFRLACTPRIRKNGEWVDADTTWITVTCWRGLAENVASSIHKGDPVIVAGRLRTSSFTRDDGVSVARVTLDAFAVGHDLARGTAAFHKAERPVLDERERDAEINSVLSTVESQAVERELEKAVQAA